jgi:hypothetical protein
LRFAASIPPGRTHRRRDHSHRVRVGVGDQLDRARLALRLVDLRLLLALGLEDRRLALAVGDVDLLLALAFGGRDHRALLALGGDLRLHRAQDRFGRREALQLVAQHLDAPRAAGFVQHRHHLVVDLVAALERLVELHLADLAAQGRLRELRDGEHVVGRPIAREPRIDHLVVDDPVHGELRVVARDADLLRDVERHFLQRMLVRDAVEERHDQVQARLEHAVELAQALDHPRVLLRDDAHALEDEHDHHGHQERGDGRDGAVREPRRRDGEDDRDDGFPEHEMTSRLLRS